MNKYIIFLMFIYSYNVYGAEKQPSQKKVSQLSEEKELKNQRQCQIISCKENISRRLLLWDELRDRIDLYNLPFKNLKN